MDPLSLLMGAAGIGANIFGQRETNKMQAEMMQQQQSFQERMSSTAYQRSSADMTAAGLNPMMMFSSGSAASTPAGASPSPNVKSGLDADAFQKAISTGVQARVANATIDNLVEQNAKIKAETATEKTLPALRNAQTFSEATRQALDMANERLRRAGLPIVENDALTAINEQKINATARRLTDQGARLGKKSSDTISPVTDVINSAAGVRRVFQRRWPDPRDYDDEVITEHHKHGTDQYRSRRYR